jgi:hypothetical protein
VFLQPLVLEHMGSGSGVDSQKHSVSYLLHASCFLQICGWEVIWFATAS